jgi:superfamily II DNA/RNA helicase
MSPSTSTGRSTTPRRRPEGGAPAGGASSAARPSSGGRPSAGKARSKSTNQSRAKSASRRDDRRGFRSENGSATASNFAPKKPSIIPIEVGPDNGFVKIGVPANLAGILAATGVTEPFSIQSVTLPDSLAGRDVLGQGRTGSGKTLAFALPLIARLAATKVGRQANRPRALILVPTRELATQVAAVIDPLATACGLRVITVFGGVGHGPQRDGLRAGAEIVVACPGRLVDHMGEGDAKLDRIEITIIDEADHMADQGFLPMVKRILDATPKVGQRMLFSATLAGGVDAIVSRYLDNPVSHAAEVEAPVLLDHSVLVIEDADRLEAVAELARKERVVIFTRTKHRAKQMAAKLQTFGINAVDMHGNLSQTARERNLAAFASGSASALVATDIAPLVVHADPPIEHKAYTHRSGRTARAGAAGRVITVASTSQVSEVKQLLQKAGVTATWTGIDVSNMTGRPSGRSAGRGGVRADGRQGGRPGARSGTARGNGGRPRR